MAAVPVPAPAGPASASGTGQRRPPPVGTPGASGRGPRHQIYHRAGDETRLSPALLLLGMSTTLLAVARRRGGNDLPEAPEIAPARAGVGRQPGRLFRPHLPDASRPPEADAGYRGPARSPGLHLGPRGRRAEERRGHRPGHSFVPSLIHSLRYAFM